MFDSWGYRALRSRQRHEHATLEASPFLDDDVRIERKADGQIFQPPQTAKHLPWVWMLLTACFASTTIVLAVQRRSCIWEFDTDLKVESLRRDRFIIKTFTGPLVYDDQGHLTIDRPEGPAWFGAPNPEQDRLWKDIDEASMVFLEGEEADLVRDQSTFWQGYWRTGLDVFHQLHCLDLVRHHIYPEYFNTNTSSRAHLLHLEHCLDYVRQALMCKADLAPVKHMWSATGQVFIPDFRTTHTCTPFEPLLEWSRERSAKQRRVKGPGIETCLDPLRIDEEEAMVLTGEGHEGHIHTRKNMGLWRKGGS